MAPADHVLFVVPWFPGPGHPSAGIFFREQAAALAQRVNVTVLHPQVRSLRGFRGGSLFTSDRDREGPVRIFRMTAYNPFPSSLRLWVKVYEWLVRRGFAEVRRQAPVTLVHAHVCWPVAGATCRVASGSGVPVVVTEHFGPFDKLLAGGYRIAYVRDAVRLAARVSAVSDALRRDMIRCGVPGDIDVLPNMVDCSRFRPSPPCRSSPPSLLFAGGMEHVKGVPQLLEAMRLVEPDLGPVRLTLAGGGPDLEALRKRALDLGLAGRCTFLGEVPHERIPGLLGEATALVLPSLAETFGVVLIEALAAGRPVVATRCGGPEEIVCDEVGALAVPGDAAALAGAIVSVCRRAESGAFSPDRLHEHACGRFGRDAFLERAFRFYRAAVPGIGGP